MRDAAREVPRALLVCSPGGHLLQMLALKAAWGDLTRVWVTLPGVDVAYLLADEDVVLGYGPAVGNRGPVAFARNVLAAWRIIGEFDPDVILSTGAGLAVPFFMVGWFHRRRLVYVESISRVERYSMSGRVIYWLADAFFVQWPGAVRGRAIYAGSVL